MTAFLEAENQFIRVDQILRVEHYGIDGGMVRALWDGGQADFPLGINTWNEGKGLPRFQIGRLAEIATEEAKQAARELINVLGMYVGQPSTEQLPTTDKRPRVVLQFQAPKRPESGKSPELGKYWAIDNISTVDSRR